MPGDATPIQAISLEFFGDNKSALDAIDSLIAKLEKLQGVADKGLKLNVSTQIDKVGKSARKTKKSIDDLQQSINDLDLSKMPAQTGDFGISNMAVKAKHSVADLATTIKRINETTSETADSAGKSIDSLVAKIDTANTRIGATVTSLLGDIKNAGVIVESIGLPEYSQASADMSKIAGLLPEISHMGITNWGLPSESSAKYINLTADAVGVLAKHASGVMALAKDTDAFTSSLGSVAKETIILQTKVDGLAVSAHNAYTEMSKVSGLLPAISPMGATNWGLPAVSSASEMKRIETAVAGITAHASGIMTLANNTDSAALAFNNMAISAHNAYAEMSKVSGVQAEISGLGLPAPKVAGLLPAYSSASVWSSGPLKSSENVADAQAMMAAAMKYVNVLERLNYIQYKASQTAKTLWKTMTKPIPQKHLPFDTVTTKLKHMTTHMNKLLGSIKRVVLYRAIRAAIKAITNAFKEGVENLYDWSNAFDSTREFANSMDRIATSALYVKNSLGAMVAPIINMLAPALDYLGDKFVEVLNIMNEFIAALTGADTYTVARKIATSFKETEDAAGGAAKAVKSFTIGIDELNIIEDNAGSGGGAGGLNKNVEDWFEKRQVDTGWIKQAAEDVRGYLEYMNPWGENTFWDYLFTPQGAIDLGATLGAISFTGIPAILSLLPRDVLDFFSDPVGYIAGHIEEGITGERTIASSLFSRLFSDAVHSLITQSWGTGVERAISTIRLYFNLARIFKSIFGKGKKGNLYGKETYSLAKDIQFALEAAFQLAINWTAKKVEGARTLFNGLRDSAISAINDIKDNIIDAADDLGIDIPEIISTIELLWQASSPAAAWVAKQANDVQMNSGRLRSATTALAKNAVDGFKAGASYSSLVSAGQYLVDGITSGIDSKKGNLYKSIEKMGKETYENFKKGAKISSPSKLFEEGGMWIVAGLNKGIAENEDSTVKTVDEWLGTFKNLSATVDVSNVSMPGMASILGEVSGNIRQSGSVAIKNETEDMRAFFDDVLMPVVNEIAADAKRQADKKETTEVYMNGRKVTEEVNRQNRANGYSFTGV